MEDLSVYLSVTVWCSIIVKVQFRLNFIYIQIDQVDSPSCGWFDLLSTAKIVKSTSYMLLHIDIKFIDLFCSWLC